MGSLNLIRGAWVDTTNLSATTRYYPNPTLDAPGAILEQASEFKLSFDVSGGVTLTVEWCGHTGSISSAPDAADWVDVTSQGRPVAGGAGAASYVDTKNTLTFTLNPGRVRVKIVTSDATNAVQLFPTFSPIEATQRNTVVTSSALPAGAATDAGGTAYVRSAAAERYITVLGAPCTLTNGSAYNSGVAKLYLVVVDQVAAPTSTVTACFPLCEVDAGGVMPVPSAVKCALGCHLCLSTTPLVYTDPGAVGYFNAWRV